MPLIPVGTINLPSRGLSKGYPVGTGHCHGGTPVIAPIKSQNSKVFIGPSKDTPVVLGQSYTSINCGNTAHANITVLESSTNVFVGPNKDLISYIGAGLSCLDSVNGNPANNVFVNI